MQLRPYQSHAKDAVFDEWSAGRKRTLLVLPTGTGKTIVFSKILEDCVRNGDRNLILAHRGELLDQAADKIAASTGLGCATEKAEQSCIGEWERIVVGSIQSITRPQRLAKFKPDYFDTIVIDEAHHALSDTYQRVLDHFSDAKVLGVTATPDRGDKQDLGRYFESIAYSYTMPEAIHDGFLSPIKAMTIPLELDISNVSTQAGDFQLAGLGTALDPYLKQIAKEVADRCRGRKVVAFLPLIETGKKFRHYLEQNGLRAVEVNGTSQDRTQKLADFDAGKYDVLCNAMLLTEGWDCPPVDTIIPLRPTKIRSLFAQMVGRGTRIHPGKDHLLLLDFLWHTSRHDLCRPAHLICESDDVAAKMTDDMANTPGMAVDLEYAEKKAEGEAIAEREEALAKQLAEQRKKKARLVDPLQFGMSIGAKDIVDYEPSFDWEREAASKDQLSVLEKAGIGTGDVTTRGKADKILDRVAKRQVAGLTTPKQIRFLERKGFKYVGQWTCGDASKMITRISASGWRVPAGVEPSDYKPVVG